MDRIRNTKLKLKPSKCELFKRKISYLGHINSAAGVETDPKKIQAVKKWPTPSYVTDVRAFLGFCNYYRKFIKRYIDIFRPLHKLLYKDTDLEWGKEQTTAFRQLKEALTQAPVLAFAQETGTFILDTDASAYGICGVLSQMQTEEGKQRRKSGRLPFTAVCARRRELLAIVEMVQYFRVSLLSRTGGQTNSGQEG